MNRNENHGMSHVDWIFAAVVVIGAIALACIGDYPEALKW